MRKTCNEISVQGKIGKIKLMLKDGSVAIVETSCKREICKKQDFITKKGESLICAPDRILINIT